MDLTTLIAIIAMVLGISTSDVDEQTIAEMRDHPEVVEAYNASDGGIRKEVQIASRPNK